MSEPALRVENLCKEFAVKKKGGLFKRLFGRFGNGDEDSNSDRKSFVAVNKVSFDIEKGEIFGLLGPNGAGKTTTIKMISTLLRPTSGSVNVHGVNVSVDPQRVLQMIGTVLAGERCVYWKLTGRENLEYFGALYGQRGPELKQRIDYLLDRFQLSKRADETVEKYSTGMKRRIVLARALLHNPRLLILDEPTAGLDPQAALNLRDLILELKGEGKTVLLTTHYMEEADILSDRVAIIDHGEIISLNTPEQLKRDLKQTKVVSLDVLEWKDQFGDALCAAGLVSNYTAQHDTANRRWRLTMHLADGVSVGAMMAAYLEQGNSVQSLAVNEPSLEDVFIHLTGKSLRD